MANPTYPRSASSEAKNSNAGFGEERNSTSSSASSPNDPASFQHLKASIGEITQDMKSRATNMADDFSEKARVSYSEATDWLKQNSGRALIVVGVLAAVGVAGYLIARSNDQRSERLAS